MVFSYLWWQEEEVQRLYMCVVADSHQFDLCLYSVGNFKTPCWYQNLQYTVLVLRIWINWLAQIANGENHFNISFLLWQVLGTCHWGSLQTASYGAIVVIFISLLLECAMVL